MAASDFEIQGLDEQVKMLRKLMSSDPDFRKRVNGVIRRVLREARDEISRNASEVLDNDPRHAYKAVRSAVYKRLLGGQVNILQKRKAGSPTGYRKPLKGLLNRGGNRWRRSGRTIQLEGYEGADRGFILRFINAGTVDRAIRTYTGTDGHRHDLIHAHKGGNRGKIAPRNWFGQSSLRALQEASENMQAYIDQVIDEELLWQT